MNKFLKVLLGLFALTGGLILIFLTIGLIAGPIEYENSVEIEASIDKTWDVFTDTSLTREWLQGYRKMEVLEGVPNQTGSKFKVYVNDQGREVIMTQTVRTVVPQEKFEFILAGEVMESEVEVDFQEVGDNTRLKAESKVRGSSIFMRSLFALMKGSFRKNDLAVYKRFKALVEGYEPPPTKLEIPVDTLNTPTEN